MVTHHPIEQSESQANRKIKSFSSDHRFNISTIILIFGLILIGITSFLPIMTIEATTFTVYSGSITETDTVYGYQWPFTIISLVLSAVILTLMTKYRSRRKAINAGLILSIVVLFFGVLIAVTAVPYSDTETVGYGIYFGSITTTATPGVGVYILLIGTIMILFGSILFSYYFKKNLKNQQ